MVRGHRGDHLDDEVLIDAEDRIGEQTAGPSQRLGDELAAPQRQTRRQLCVLGHLGGEPIARIITGPCIIENCNSQAVRSEEHTSELQSRFDLVCRLLLEKKHDSKYSLRTRTTPGTR